MKYMILIFIMQLSTFAYADSYECFAKANPNRGFSADFSIQVVSDEAGGEVYIEASAKSTRLGTVVQSMTVGKSEDFFAHILGLIWEEDVSGVQQEKMSEVDSVRIIEVQPTSEENIFIYQLLAGSKQIGGTFFLGGRATACVRLN